MIQAEIYNTEET